VSKTTRPIGNLRRLNLWHGKLTGSQLLNFVQLPQPVLKDLYLNDVQGFTNNDLLLFLLEVAATVTTLYIGCPHIEKSPDEPFAIDVAIAKMGALERLYIAGSCCSALVLSQKPPLMSGDSNRPSWAHNSRHPAIDISFGVDWNWDDLLQALVVSEWRSISFFGGGMRARDTDDRLKHKAKEMAAERDITFYLE
jgi:hypothetical protein